MIWLQLTPIVSPQLIAAAPFAAFILLLVIVAVMPTVSLFMLFKGFEDRRWWLVALAAVGLVACLGLADVALEGR